MVSEVERLSHEVEALRVRVEALERRLVPVADVSEEEARELERLRGEAVEGDYVPLDEVLARYGKWRLP
jgi:archaellum component FlaC